MPSETLDRCTCDGIEIGTHAAAVVVATPEHMRGRHYGCYTMRDTLAIDACVLPEIAFLWRLGIVTTGSCCGHNQQPGYIGVAREDVPRMEALGYQHSVKHTGEPHPEAFLPRWTLRAAHQERDADARRLDWLLLDSQPDAIGELDLWERVDAEDDDECWSQYLRAARAAIDAAMAADTQTPNTEQEHAND